MWGAVFPSFTPCYSRCVVHAAVAFRLPSSSLCLLFLLPTPIPAPGRPPGCPPPVLFCPLNLVFTHQPEGGLRQQVVPRCAPRQWPQSLLSSPDSGLTGFRAVLEVPSSLSLTLCEPLPRPEVGALLFVWLVPSCQSGVCFQCHPVQLVLLYSQGESLVSLRGSFLSSE